MTGARDHSGGSAAVPWLPTPYPRQVNGGAPEPSKWRRWADRSLVTLLIIGGFAAVPALGYALLQGLNPMGDEWVCSEGEAPASDGCHRTDEDLPAGVQWDPLGNRPMPYNCDKDGWTLIEHDRREIQDCLSVHLPVPVGWHEVK